MDIESSFNKQKSPMHSVLVKHTFCKQYIIMYSKQYIMYSELYMYSKLYSKH